MDAIEPDRADEHPDAVAAPRWTVAQALVVLLAGVFGGAIGLGVAVAITGADPNGSSLATVIGSLVGMWLAYVATIGPLVRTRGTGRPVDDLRLRFRPIDIAVGIAVGLVTSIVIVNVIYELLELLRIVDAADLEELADPAEDLADGARGAGFVVLALFIGVGAPIAEEIVFRGFLQSAAVRRLGTPLGVALTAIVFGAVHFQPLQFPALAAFGLVLGLLVVKTGRLWPGIVAHMVFNGLTLLYLASAN